MKTKMQKRISVLLTAALLVGTMTFMQGTLEVYADEQSQTDESTTTPDNSEPAGNDETETETVSTPTISLKTGTYYGNQKVTIKTSTEDATIYYATGSSWKTYSGAITLKANKSGSKKITLRAYAEKNDVKSDTAKANYTLKPKKSQKIKVSSSFARLTGESFKLGQK